MAKDGTCVYCGQVGPLTEDHIPPKSLFAKPRPPDLLKVPSCLKCNGQASADDEYFKTVLVLKERAGSHPEARSITASVFRAFENERKVRFRANILRKVRDVDIRTPMGLYLGSRLAFDVELFRLDRVASRITKALFWKHFNRRLPDDIDVAAYSEHGLRSMAAPDRKALREKIVPAILQQPSHSIGRGVLRYWYTKATDQENFTVWVLEVYGDVHFLAFTLPRHVLAQRRTTISRPPTPFA